MATALAPDRIVRVAIDGVDGAGKTTFANELAEVVGGLGRPVIRASVDGFHNPRVVRYAQAKQSAIGFFENSYNYALLKQYLLNPLSPSATVGIASRLSIALRIFPYLWWSRKALPTSILLFDGIFLQRPE
jgi:uridine kinase